jgi:hypothetical protein
VLPLRGRARRRKARRVRLGGAAATATAALVAAEVARVWHRGHAPSPAARGPVLRGGGIAARETAEVVRAGYRAGSANETALLNLFLAFGAALGLARAVTHSIRHGAGPWHNVAIGRRHIHHYVPGILLVLLSGGVSITMRHERLDPWLAWPFGAGAALIVDETALLLELSDVYWSERGALSIDVSLGTVAGLAVLTLVVRIVRRGEAVVLAA